MYIVHVTCSLKELYRKIPPLKLCNTMKLQTYTERAVLGTSVDKQAITEWSVNTIPNSAVITSLLVFVGVP